ncbi:MAG: ATP-binding protein [Chitinophagaceae bacterium]
MKLFLLTVFAFIFFVHPASSQKKGQALIDSLLPLLPTQVEDSNKVKMLSSLAQSYSIVDPASGFDYAEKSLSLAKKINWKQGIANSYNTLGLMVGDSGNNTLARSHFEKSLTLNTELGSKFRMIANLNNIGRSYQRESDFIRATENYYKALAIAEEIKSNEQIALVGTNLTASFATQQNYPKATQYAEMTVKYGQLANTPNHTSKGLLLLGIIKMKTGDSASARQYMAKAYQLYSDMGNKPQMAGVLANMAQLEYPDYKKAIGKYLEAKTIYDEIGPSSVGAIANLNNIGEAYLSLAGVGGTADIKAYLAEANRYLLKAAELSGQTGNMEYLANVQLSLAEVEKLKGNYKAAFEYYQRGTTINDSLFSQERKNELAGIESNYQIALKDNEIAINNLSLSNQRRTGIALVVGLVSFAVLITLLFLQSRSRMKTNTKLMELNTRLDEANKTKARFFGILSHDLRRPVSNLINFLHLQKNGEGILQPASYEVHQERIRESAEDLLDTMEAMLLWSKEQMESFKPEFNEVEVKKIFDFVGKTFSEADKTIISFDYPPGLTINSDENYLRIILQNLTSNSLKAVGGKETGSIVWSAMETDGKVILSIHDNGGGISYEQARILFDDRVTGNGQTGLGLHLVRDLASAIGYTIAVDSDAATGTTFTLTPAAHT